MYVRKIIRLVKGCIDVLQDQNKSLTGPKTSLSFLKIKALLLGMFCHLFKPHSILPPASKHSPFVPRVLYIQIPFTLCPNFCVHFFFSMIHRHVIFWVNKEHKHDRQVKTENWESGADATGRAKTACFHFSSTLLCLCSLYIMSRRPMGKVEVHLYASLTSALDWVDGQHQPPAALLPRKTKGGPQGRCAVMRKILPPPEFEPKPSSP